MQFSKKFNLLKRMDANIQRKSTGNAEQFANKLGVSRASVFRYINDLKNMGADIEYSHDRNSYEYQNPFDFS